MGISIRSCAVLALASTAVLAGPVAGPVPTPAITPAAILPRADYSTLGWYSAATSDGDTIYSPWEFNADEVTYSASGDFFRRCPVTTSCTMYTGCSEGYLMGGGSSSYCGAGGASGSLFCSNHILYTTIGASSALSWFWCDEAPLTAYTFYGEEPAQPSFDSSSQVPASSDASTTISSSEQPSSSVSETASSTAPPAASDPAPPPPPPSGSSTNVGAIAGGVVGGLALLGALGFAAFFLWRRKKNKTAAAAAPAPAPAPPPGQPPMGYQQTPQSPYQQPGFPQSPNSAFAAPLAYQANEQKPPGVQEAVGYYSPPPQQPLQPQQYPNGPYDPHQSQYYGGPGSPPLSTTSPGPGLSPGPGATPVQSVAAAHQAYPQELPALVQK